VTCTSPMSRNYQVGYALGQGHSLEESVARLGQVAEGGNTLRVLRQKSEEEGVYRPLVAGVHAIIFEQQPLQEVRGRLMRAEQQRGVECSAFLPRRATDKEQPCLVSPITSPIPTSGCGWSTRCCLRSPGRWSSCCWPSAWYCRSVSGCSPAGPIRSWPGSATACRSMPGRWAATSPAPVK